MKMPFGKCTCDNEFLSNWAYVIVFVFVKYTLYLDNNKKLWFTTDLFRGEFFQCSASASNIWEKSGYEVDDGSK